MMIGEDLARYWLLLRATDYQLGSTERLQSPLRKFLCSALGVRLPLFGDTSQVTPSRFILSTAPSFSYFGAVLRLLSPHPATRRVTEFLRQSHVLTRREFALTVSL